MIKAIIDNNVWIDYFLNRNTAEGNFADHANELLEKSVYGLFVPCITVDQTTNLYYVLEVNHVDARKEIGKLIDFCEIIDVTKENCKTAISSKNTSDYEDALIIASARRNGIRYIATRNIKDFQNSGMIALTPEQFLKSLREKGLFE